MCVNELFLTIIVGFLGILYTTICPDKSHEPLDTGWGRDWGCPVVLIGDTPDNFGSLYF